jgi:hypothetical protein
MLEQREERTKSFGFVVTKRRNGVVSFRGQIKAAIAAETKTSFTNSALPRH